MPNPRLDFLAAVYGMDPNDLQAGHRRKAIERQRSENEDSAEGFSSFADLANFRGGLTNYPMNRTINREASPQVASLYRNAGGPIGYAQDDMMRRAASMRGQSSPGGAAGFMHEALGRAPLFQSTAGLAGPDGNFDAGGLGRMGLDALSFATFGFNPYAMAAGEITNQALAGARIDPIAKAIAASLASATAGGAGPGAAGSLASQSPTFTGSPLGQAGTSMTMGVAQGTMQRMQQIRQNRQNQQSALGFQKMPYVQQFAPPPSQGGFMSGGMY